MTIAAVLRTKGSAVETIAADASVADAVRRLGEKRIGALPVLDDGRIVGIGKAGNPDTQPGVDIIIGPGTEVISCAGRWPG